MEKLLRYNKNLKQSARSLRCNMTDCERKLWGLLRGKRLAGLQFYRQKPIGNFIVDFYCPVAKLVIEVDGGQHFTEAALRHDRTRDRYLEDADIRVVRVSNLDVIQNMEAVLEMIQGVLQEQISSNPSLQKRGIAIDSPAGDLKNLFLYKGRRGDLKIPSNPPLKKREGSL